MHSEFVAAWFAARRIPDCQSEIVIAWRQRNLRATRLNGRKFSQYALENFVEIVAAGVGPENAFYPICVRDPIQFVFVNVRAEPYRMRGQLRVSSY
jgi:hypothetical protein